MSQSSDERVWKDFLWQRHIWQRRIVYLAAMKVRMAKMVVHANNTHLNELTKVERRHTTRLALLVLASLGVDKGMIDEEWQSILSSTDHELNAPPEQDYI